jgi:hypothetical protein
MDRFRVELVRGGQLDDLPEVHDRDTVRDVTNDVEVVGDEEIGEPELALQVLE